jgi:NADPH-dependent ferric siderophore reductase
MPKMPKWVADAMESLVSNRFLKVAVSDCVYIHPSLKKITFSGDLRNIKFKTGQAVIFRVDDTNFRNYTPCVWDSASGRFEIIFHLHGRGPGSNYISGLQVNDTLLISPPRGFDFYKKKYNHHFFFGDETSIGFFKSLEQEIEGNGQQYTGILELNSDAALPDAFPGSRVKIVKASTTKAEQAILFLQSIPEARWELCKTGMFYLMGNARSIQAFRKALKEKGISSKQILTQPYWAEGKIGL